ncbi:hypothetical protein LSAT2_011110 [Lamellibrachia satsuma]|nr:hypothetical protein LSAT2_011110 [Lamellibrachia satsuma]
MLARNGTPMPNRYRMSVAEADACVASNNGGGDYHTVASSRILQGILKRAPAVRSNTVSDIRRYRSEYSLSTAGHRADADAPFPRKTSGTTRKLYDRRAAASLKLSTVGGEWALNACEGHTRWANGLLKGTCPQITDLRKSISDGTTLVNIVELLRVYLRLASDETGLLPLSPVGQSPL